jgi:ubiquinone/menaquinone biosynthesis C-methylase UbiE
MNRTTNSWEKNAQIDPLFAILTDETKRGSWNTENFFASGENEIGRVLAFIDTVGIKPNFAGKFLDFGCGVGRNTRALIKRFTSGIGIDVSPKMISRARQLAETDSARADYAVNYGDDLSTIPTASIDFLYCHIVLQHIPTRLQRQFITEFMRVLSLDGIAAFQIATGWISYNPKLVLKAVAPHWVRAVYQHARGREIRIEMNVLSHKVAQAICVDGGGVVISTPYTNSTEPNCNGNVEFMDRKQRIDQILHGAAQSHYLSEFFFVKKRTRE